MSLGLGSVALCHRCPVGPTGAASVVTRAGLTTRLIA